MQKRFSTGKVVLFGQKLLYSDKKCCIRAQWLYSGNVVVIGQSGCFRAKMVVCGLKWLYSGKSGCFWDKWLYSGKVVALGQGGCIRAKVVVFGQCGCIQVRWPW